MFFQRAAELYGPNLKLFVTQTLEKIRTTTKSASYEGEAFWHTEDELNKNFKPHVVAHVKANARKLMNSTTGEVEWEVFRYKTKTVDATEDKEVLKRKAEVEETKKAPKKVKQEQAKPSDDGEANPDKGLFTEKQLKRVQTAYDKIVGKADELDKLFQECSDPSMSEYVQTRHMTAAERTLESLA
eukprot:7907731-Pyramimonas_sp.AAC.1